MTKNITVNVTDDLKEFKFNGNSSEYKKFITLFNTGEIILQKEQCEFYPVEIEKIKILKNSNSKLLITFSVEKTILIIKGGNDKFKNLLRSIENLSNLSKTGHFHIDHLGNSDLISQKNISLVLNLKSLD